MNNSFLIDSQEPVKVPDNTETLKNMETRTVRIIEAIAELEQSKAWSTLKELVFDDLVGRLEREMLYEAKRADFEERNLAHLTGQLVWAIRYADLGKFSKDTKLELQRLRQLLYGKQE